MLGGRVHVMIDAITSMRGAIPAGKSGRSRSRRGSGSTISRPADGGGDLPGFEAMGWMALMAPPGTPAPLARRDQRRSAHRAGQARVKKRFEDLGTYIRPTTPEELTAFIREQQAIWRPVIAETAKKIN